MGDHRSPALVDNQKYLCHSEWAVSLPHPAVIPSVAFSTKKICVIPSEAEESRGNEFFLIPRDGGITVV